MRKLSLAAVIAVTVPCSAVAQDIAAGLRAAYCRPVLSQVLNFASTFPPSSDPATSQARGDYVAGLKAELERTTETQNRVLVFHMDDSILDFLSAAADGERDIKAAVDCSNALAAEISAKAATGKYTTDQLLAESKDDRRRCETRTAGAVSRAMSCIPEAIKAGSGN